MNEQLPAPDDLAAIRAQIQGISDQLARIEKQPPRVVVSGVRIGFFAWVDLLVRVALASIPALIIVGAALFFLLAILSIVFGIGIMGR